LDEILEMAKLRELLSSSEFWFATVLIAFVVNLVSGFAKDT
jgi:hypothetical protein